MTPAQLCGWGEAQLTATSLQEAVSEQGILTLTVDLYLPRVHGNHWL